MRSTFLTLGLALSFSLSLLAPEPPKPRTAAPPAAPAAAAEVKADPVVDAWVRVLGAKIADANATVRQSAQQGLVSVGKPAEAFLQTLASGADAAVAAE